MTVSTCFIDLFLIELFIGIELHRLQLGLVAAALESSVHEEETLRDGRAGATRVPHWRVRSAPQEE